MLFAAESNAMDSRPVPEDEDRERCQNCMCQALGGEVGAAHEDRRRDDPGVRGASPMRVRTAPIQTPERASASRRTARPRARPMHPWWPSDPAP